MPHTPPALKALIPTCPAKRYIGGLYTWQELVSFAINQSEWKSSENKLHALNLFRRAFDRNELTMQEFGFLFLILSRNGM